MVEMTFFHRYFEISSDLIVIIEISLYKKEKIGRTLRITKYP